MMAVFMLEVGSANSIAFEALEKKFSVIADGGSAALSFLFRGRQDTSLQKPRRIVQLARKEYRPS